MKSHNNYKLLFNHIISNKYEIIKDSDSNNTMKIIYNNCELKCKYILLFTIENNNQKKLLWSFSNPFIDQKTKLISLFIKNAIEEKEPNVFDWNNFTDKDLINVINIIVNQNLKIYYDKEYIDPIWIIKGFNKKYFQYYMITDIVYY